MRSKPSWPPFHENPHRLTGYSRPGFTATTSQMCGCTTKAMGQLERPYLLLDETGRPTTLFAASGAISETPSNFNP